MLRIANLVMIVLFVSWAYFQWNDPDPLVWMTIYGTAALACILFAFERLPETAAIAFSACCGLGALYLAGRVVLERQFIFDEMGREMIGLLIVGAWTGRLAWQVRRRGADRQRDLLRPDGRGGKKHEDTERHQAQGREAIQRRRHDDHQRL